MWRLYEITDTAVGLITHMNNCIGRRQMLRNCLPLQMKSKTLRVFWLPTNVSVGGTCLGSDYNISEGYKDYWHRWRGLITHKHLQYVSRWHMLRVLIIPVYWHSLGFDYLRLCFLVAHVLGIWLAPHVKAKITEDGGFVDGTCVQVWPYLPLNMCPLVTWISILYIEIWI